MLRNIRTFFMLPILLFICMSSYAVYRYMFTIQPAKITIVLDDLEEFSFKIRPEACFDQDVSEPEYVNVNAVNPFVGEEEFGNPTYTALAVGKEISTTIGFENGTVHIATLKSAIAEPITSTWEITSTGRRLSFTAKNVSAYYDPGDKAILNEHICSPEISFRPKYQDIDVHSYNVLNPTDEKIYSAVNIDHYFYGDDNNNISFQVENFSWDGKLYAYAIVRYHKNKETLRPTVNFAVQGQEIGYVLPIKSGSDSTSNTNIQNALSHQISMTGPVGKMTVVGNYSDIDFSPPIGSIDKRDLVIQAVSTFMVQPNTNGGYEVSGDALSVVWGERQILRSRWQELPVELQAVLITASLAVVGWIANRYVSPTKKDTSTVNNSHGQAVASAQIVVPQGYLVLVLSSGRAVAGKLRVKPTFLSHRYILADAMFRDTDGHWRSSTIQEVAIEARQVEYSYWQSGAERRPSI